MPPSTVEIANTSVLKPCQTMRSHTGGVSGIVHPPDGRCIITCSHDRSLLRWDLESGAQIGDDWRDERDEAQVWCIALSPNGKTIASGSIEGTVRLWNVETEEVIAKWAGHTTVVRSLCWSADGERVVSGSVDGTARVWNVESGKTVLGPIRGHAYVSTVIYSPDMTKIATGGENAVKIWDAITAELLSTLKHENPVYCLAWTSDQKKLISGSFGFIRIFDTATWQQIAILEDHRNYHVCALSLFRNGRLLASAANDRTARLWNLDTNLPVGPPIQHEHEVRCAAFSADGKVLVTGCVNVNDNEQDSNVYAWDIHTTLKQSGHEDLLFIPDVAASPLEQKIAGKKPLMNSDPIQRQRPARHEHARLPQGFFDGTPGNNHSSSTSRSFTLSPSSTPRPHAFLGRFSSLFHSPKPTIGESTWEIQQPQRQHMTCMTPHQASSTVEVAPVRDKQALYVTPQQETVSERVKRIKNPTWWTRCVLFICCVSVPSPDTNSHQ